MAAPAAASSVPAKAAASCPSFRVLHNDHISAVSFPAGPYQMVNSGMWCAQTTKYFQQFLNSGHVPSGWTVKLLSRKRRRFTKLHTNPTVDFQATPISDPAPTPTPSGLSCAGSFRVLHNHHIGAMKLPAGRYTIKLASHDTPGLNCKVASNEFASFLEWDWNGVLPRPWKMNVGAKSFYMSAFSSDGFSVRYVGG